MRPETRGRKHLHDRVCDRGHDLTDEAGPDHATGPGVPVCLGQDVVEDERDREDDRPTGEVKRADGKDLLRRDVRQ